MSEQIFNCECGFFNSLNNDREYYASDINRPYKRIVSNGVFATPQGTPSTDLQVVSDSNVDMGIIVKSGDGLFADKWFNNVTDITITVPSNSGVTPRIDSVIVQINNQLDGRVGSIVYRTGTPNSNPVKPDINTETDIIEYRIANIYVGAGATHINTDAITDLRGSSECPWITSLIQQVDTSTLYDQWRAAYQNYYDTETQAFNDWLETLTSELTVATSVVKYESRYTTVANGETEIPINISAYNKDKDVLLVRVNKLFAVEEVDYTIDDNSQITLTKDLNEGNSIDFICLQSVVVGDTTSLISSVTAISEQVSELTTEIQDDSGWINFTLESGSAYDSASTPACRKTGKVVSLRGAVKGITNTGSTICTLPSAMRPSQAYQFVSSAFTASSVLAVVIEVGTNGAIKLIAKNGTISATAKMSIATNFIIG